MLWNKVLPFRVGVKQPSRFLYKLRVSSDDSEAAAVIDVQVRHIERQNVELLPIHQHHFAVIAHQISRRPGDRDAPFKQLHLELAQVSFPSAIRECNQCMDEHSALDRVHQRPRNFIAIKAKNYDLNALFRLLNAFEKSIYTIPRLDQ
jgi:hypothetical protein